jgi:hypothetical protein
MKYLKYYLFNKFKNNSKNLLVFSYIWGFKVEPADGRKDAGSKDKLVLDSEDHDKDSAPAQDPK